MTKQIFMDGAAEYWSLWSGLSQLDAWHQIGIFLVPGLVILLLVFSVFVSKYLKHGLSG